jgi:hypothetical protein
MPPFNKTCSNKIGCIVRNEKELCLYGLPICYGNVTAVTSTDCVLFVSSSQLDCDTGNSKITHLLYHGYRSVTNRVQIFNTSPLNVVG